jgi:hypothetical protein
MALISKSKQIGEHTFTVTQLPARQGAEGLRRLGARVSPLVASLAKEVSSGGDPNSAILGGLAGVVTSLSEQDLSYYIEIFGDSSTVTMEKGAPKVKAVFDILFAGKYEDMLEFLLFAFEVNYSGFFQSARARLTAALGAAQAPEGA